MHPCAFCGRVNDPASRFCIDCGKPLSSSAARVTPALTTITPPNPVPYVPPAPGGVVPATRVSSPVGGVGGAQPASPAAGAALAARGAPAAGARDYGSCPHCGQVVNASLPFCSHCGKRTGLALASGPSCPSCGGSVRPGLDLYCGRCGASVAGAPATAAAAGTAVFAGVPREALPTLALLDDAGEVAHTYALDRGELIVGRADGDIRFPEDVYLSPIHALFAMREGALWLRDLGSRNGSWVFGERAFRLSDGDVILVGSQLLRFRRLGYPGPHPPEADATRRLGSLVPSADVAVLQQLRSDGSVRDTLHLSPGRNVVLGRESGDWVFPYDQTMSGRHAEIRSEDSEFVVHDLDSRNGVAVAVRGERKLERGQRVLIGDQILRVEMV